MIVPKKKICRGCKQLRNLFSKGVCWSCWSKAFAKPIKKSTTISKMSRKHKDRILFYKALREDYLKEHPICEFDNCTNKADQIHHKSFRDGDNLFLNFMGICSKHHRHIHDNPEQSYEKGYLISRLKKNNEK